MKSNPILVHDRGSADGWDPEGIVAGLRQAVPRLAYLIPDFQRPTGFRMSVWLRERIAAEARRTRTVVVVDETLVEVDLTGQTVPRWPRSPKIG